VSRYLEASPEEAGATARYVARAGGAQWERPPSTRPKLSTAATARCLRPAWLATCRGLSATSNLGAAAHFGRGPPGECGNWAAVATVLLLAERPFTYGYRAALRAPSSFVCRGPGQCESTTHDHFWRARSPPRPPSITRVLILMPPRPRLHPPRATLLLVGPLVSPPLSSLPI
jgi:hypothetical protein